MNCTNYREWFSAYVDERLGSTERAQLEAHLKGCERCRADLSSLQQMLHSLQRMEPSAPPELLRGIHEQLACEPWWRVGVRRFLAPWPASLPWHGLALATTAALVVVVVGLQSALHQRDVSPLLENVNFNSIRGPLAGRDLMRLAKEPISRRTRFEERTAGTSQNDAFLPERRAANALTYQAAGDAAEELQETQAQSQSTPAFGKGWAAQGLAQPQASKAESDADMGEKKARKADPETPPLTLADSDAPMSSARQVASLAQPERRAISELLQVQWRAQDLGAAAARVIEWVSAQQGFAVATNERHLSVRLPGRAVAEFLQQFSSHPISVPPLEPFLWVTISLELIPSE